jgi:hypothetical protein
MLLGIDFLARRGILGKTERFRSVEAISGFAESSPVGLY